jgi:hypothetical protein
MAMFTAFLSAECGIRNAEYGMVNRAKDLTGFRQINLPDRSVRFAHDK